MLFWPVDLADLQCFLSTLPPSERIIFLGLGSNVLFPDGILDATVIITVKGLNAMRTIDRHRLQVECGVSCAKVAKNPCIWVTLMAHSFQVFLEVLAVLFV